MLVSGFMFFAEWKLVLPSCPFILQCVMWRLCLLVAHSQFLLLLLASDSASLSCWNRDWGISVIKMFVGLTWQYMRVLLVWSLWEQTRYCPILDKSQLQMAQNGICFWKKLRQWPWLHSVRPDLRKEKIKYCAAGREEWENEREMDQQAPRSVQENGWRCSRCAAEALCSSGEAHGEAGCPATAHGHHMEHIFACSPKCHCGCFLKELQPMESPCRSSPGPEPQPMGTLCWSRCWRVDSVVRSLAGTVLGRLQPMRSPSRISLGRMAAHGRDIMLELGQAMKEQQTCSFMDWQQPPFPVLLYHSGEVGGRGWMKWKCF